MIEKLPKQFAAKDSMKLSGIWEAKIYARNWKHWCWSALAFWNNVWWLTVSSVSEICLISIMKLYVQEFFWSSAQKSTNGQFKPGTGGEPEVTYIGIVAIKYPKDRKVELWQTCGSFGTTIWTRLSGALSKERIVVLPTGHGSFSSWVNRFITPMTGDPDEGNGKGDER